MSHTFWDRAAGLYDLFEWSNRKVNAAARTRVGELVPAGARVLDCAAGTGEFSLAAARRAKSVLCTDQSEAMLARARKKVRKRGLSNVNFARRDVTDLPDPGREL
ncbi:MAG: class I SAM-dependent methyltransferase [Oscillospiraceae bacterium]|nr:class I SAM-dependent methyltransferase [Oscillospiraceae bacterium]